MIEKFELDIYVSSKHIAWSRHLGHANDPLSIALRHHFGFSKTMLVISLGGEHHAHKRLTVIVHDYEAPLLLHSYELAEDVQRALWRWLRHEPVYPFKCKVVFTDEQIKAIVEHQRIRRLPSTGMDKVQPLQ